MRRIYLLTLLLVSLSVGAQGTWRVSHRDADPMKRQTEQDVYIYDVKGVGSVVVWDWKKPDFRLITDKYMFKNLYSSGEKYVPVKVGFYDDDGNMEKMFTVILYPEDNHMGKYIATGDFYPLGRKDIKKIISRMKSGKGFVRFLVMRLEQSDFDIRVYPFERK